MKKENNMIYPTIVCETKLKNKEKQTKEETLEKYRLSQGRMNRYKREWTERMTEKNIQI